MKRQSTSLIFMALLGASTATNTATQADVTIALDSDAGSLLDQTVIQDETDLIPVEDTLTETDLDEDFEPDTVLQSMEPQTVLSSSPLISKYFNADPRDRTLGSSSDDIKLLSGRAYQMHDEVNGYVPQLTSVIGDTKNNTNGVYKQYKSASDQAGYLGDIGQKVHKDSYDIKLLENQLRKENESIGQIKNNLITLRSQSELNGQGNDQAVVLLKELNSQIVQELTESQKSVDNITNNLKIVNNRQVSLSSGMNDNSNNDNQRLKKLSKDLQEMQLAISHNYELANQNNMKLSNYKTTVGDFDSNVQELQNALRGPILQKFQDLKVDEGQLTDSMVKLQSSYNDYRNQTGNKLKNTRKQNEQVYNDYENKFTEYEDQLQQQNASAEQIKTKLQSQLKLSSSRDQDDQGKINERIQNQFDNSEAVLGNYYNNFNKDKDTINTNISLLLKNLNVLGDLYTDTKQNNFEQLGELEEKNNQSQNQFKQKINDLENELTNLQSGWDSNLNSKFTVLTEQQKKEQQGYAQEKQLLKQYQKTLQEQDEEISNLKNRFGRGKKAMAEDINLKFNDYQGKITGLKSQLENRNHDLQDKVTALQTKQEKFNKNSQKHDDMLRRWIQGTHDQLTELSSVYNLEISKLKESVKDNKINRSNNLEQTEKQIKTYLKSMKDEQSQNDSKKQLKLQQAAEDRENQEISLRAEIATMECDYDDIIDVLCWDNHCKRDYFEKYLLKQAHEPALQEGYLLSSGAPDQPKYTLKITNITDQEAQDDDDSDSG